MSRRRIVPDNSIQHIVNRGNDKKVIFPKPVDYAAFLVLLREARELFAVHLYAYCLMPNHFHLVVCVANLAALSAYMHYVEREHACDLRQCYRSKGHGHVFQRRYWNDTIESDGRLIRLIRYVEANPLRAQLVTAPEQWEWSSFWDRETGERDLLHPTPYGLPQGWKTIVSVPQQPIDLEEIRTPIKMGRPAKFTGGVKVKQVHL
jgi:putative transposase